MRRLVMAIGSGAIGVLCLVALTACDPLDVPIPSASASATGVASASPSASAAPVSIPLDCRNVVDQATYAKAFGDTPLNDPAYGPNGTIQPSAAPGGATPIEQLRAATQLRCLWADPGADITGLTATFARVDPAIAGAYLDSLPADGYTCEAKYGGRWCQKIGEVAQYEVEQGDTSFLRDDVYIEISQTNFPTSGLLENIVATIWH